VIRTISARAENVYGSRGFSGRTDKGIALGDSPEAVLAAYGEPVDLGTQAMIHYRSGITFGVRRGIVDEIVILRSRFERPPGGESPR
jgi:hypothetical protein